MCTLLKCASNNDLSMSVMALDLVRSLFSLFLDFGSIFQLCKDGYCAARCFVSCLRVLVIYQ